MLKKILLNNRLVPVPVPVRTLSQALAWVEANLVPGGSLVTRVVLDRDVIDYDNAALAPKKGQIELTEKSRLEIQMDSPATLAE